MALELEGECTLQCPVAAAAAILDGKWTTLIFRDLLRGTQRYSALQRGLDGISPRMLAMRLTSLEQSGLIVKTIYPTIPPKTEYALSELGRQVAPVIGAMAEFGARLLARDATR